MYEAYETHEVDGLTVEIHQDPEPESPREWDNLGTILYVSHHYTLGDLRVEPEVIDRITKRKDVVWLPVYAYIHSGVRLRTGSFQGLLPQGHAEFDSGQCGIIYVEYDKIRKEYSCKRVTKKIIAKVERVLNSEIDTYNDYFCGDVWGYNVKDEDGEIVESCWGFYGLDYCREEAKDTAKCVALHRAKQARRAVVTEC